METMSTVKFTVVGALVAALGMAGPVPDANAQPSASGERVVRRLGGTHAVQPAGAIGRGAAADDDGEASRSQANSRGSRAGQHRPAGHRDPHHGCGDETTVAPGEHLEWMALRRKGRADVLRNVRWGGAKPFAAFRFTVDTPTMGYVFVVPEDCGNLSLVSATAVAPKPAPPPPPPPPRRRRRHRRRPRRRRPRRRRRNRSLRPCSRRRPPPPVDKIDPFIMGAFGKQRRTLETDEIADASLEQSFCDPLIGIKGGVQFQVKPNLMFAPAVGVAFNLDDSERTSVFVDAELNYTFDNGGYIGTGLGVWDVFDDGTLNLLLHAGAPVAQLPRRSVPAAVRHRGPAVLRRVRQHRQQLPVLGRPPVRVPVRRSPARRSAVSSSEDIAGPPRHSFQ